MLEEGGEFSYLADNTKRKNSVSRLTPTPSLNISGPNAPVFAKTSAPLHTKQKPKSGPDSPKKFHLKSASISFSRMRPQTGKITMSRNESLQNLQKKQLQQQQNKGKVAMASLTKTNGAEIIDVNALIKMTEETSQTGSHLKHPMSAHGRRKKLPKRKEDEEITIDKISDIHFMKFKNKVTLYNRYYYDYLADPEIRFNSMKDLRIDLKNKIPARKVGSIILEGGGSFDGYRRRGKPPSLKDKRLNEQSPYNNRKFSAKDEDLESPRDFFAESKLARKHFQNIKSIDEEKSTLNSEMLRMQPTNLDPKQLQFLEAVKVGNLNEATLMLMADRSLMNLRDGVS